MKDQIYLLSPNFIEEKLIKIFDMHGDIGFIARLGLLSELREQEIITLKKKRFVLMAMVVTVIVYIKLTVKMD